MAKRRGDVTGQLNFGFVGSAVKRAMAKAKKVKKTRAKKARRKKASSRKARSKQVKRKRKARRKTSAPKTNTKTISKQRITVAATAESMAAKQRAISISEFFAKNRHLLGFDNPRKALLTAVKEAVDNSLDACEEARI
ncbi:MAG: DNA topoisomerase VI subunit B, partial [Planctomycetota bacterium]